MNKINPYAIVFWAICGLLGYLIADGKGAAVALILAMGSSLAASIGDL